MPQVEFRAASVQAHGLPQACVCCGNDEDHQLVVRSLARQLPSGCMVGGCLLFFMGPIGWLISLGLAYAATRKKLKIQLPVCLLCRKASRYQATRLGCFLVTAGLLFGVDVASLAALPMHGYGILASIVIGLYGLSEYAWLNRQFSMRTIKNSDQAVLVQIPNDDYPALYQRHLDNALLYGSSVNLGTSADEG